MPPSWKWQFAFTQQNSKVRKLFVLRAAYTQSQSFGGVHGKGNKILVDVRTYAYIHAIHTGSKYFFVYS